MCVIWLDPGFDPPPADVVAHAATRVVGQTALTPADLAGARGLVTGNALDQDAFLALRPTLEAFLDRGGRWFLNGHILRPLVAGLARYVPMAGPTRRDFVLTPLAPHPLFAEIDLARLETNRGVAGFYGRGANPMPDGAIAVTGLRGGAVPVDWLWCRPGGGRIFSHAGNDLGQLGLEWGLAPVLRARILGWANGGDCLCV